MNVYKERENGQEAERILQNPIYAEAWTAYRLRLLEEIEAAPSDATERVLHLKRMLSVATAVRGHLERIMKEGSFAAKSIEIEEKRGRLTRIFNGR